MARVNPLEGPERMSDDPKRIVERGYDAIAERYLAWSGGRPSPTRLRALELLAAELAPESQVLDLGCGAGIPMTADLAERHRVHGVDISAGQIALATRNVPRATFQQADMASVDFPEATFHAVVAFYAFTHLPRDELGPLLERIARWLRPGGLLFATMGAHADAGTVEDDWLGAPMFFSHHDADTNRPGPDGGVSAPARSEAILRSAHLPQMQDPWNS